MIANAVGFETLVKREMVRTFSIINQVVWPPIIQHGKLVALEATQKLIGDGSLQDVFLELTRR